MTPDGMMRASDADRDAVVEVLRDAYTEGRLTLGEFDERTSAAYAGRTWGALRELTADLPVQPVLGADLPAAALPSGGDSGDEGDGPDLDPARLPPDAVRRRGRAVGVTPFVMIWFLIMIAARSSAEIIAPIVLVAVLILVITISRRK